MDDPSAKEESSEIVTQNDGATRRQKPVQEDNADNYVKNKNINEMKEDFDKMREQNETLREKLREAGERAKMAKNEVKNIAIEFSY
jgi:hypothetical protein